jgi:hypothetical protein
MCMLNHMEVMWCVKFYNFKKKIIWLVYKWVFGTFENIFIWGEQLVERKFFKNKLVKGNKNLVFKDIDCLWMCEMHGKKMVWNINYT